MGIVGLIIVLMLLRFDLSLLRLRARELYQHTMVISNQQALLYWFLLIMAAGISVWQKHSYLGWVLGILTIIYFLKRKEFFERLKVEPQTDLFEADEQVGLALNTLPMMGWWFIGLTIIQTVFFILMEIFHQPMDDLMMVLVFSEMSSLVLLVLIYQAVKRFPTIRFMDVLGLQTQGLSFLKIWVWPALGALGYALISGFILGSRTAQPMTPLQELLNSTTSVWVMMLFVGTAVLTAPFFEEIIFRGFFFYVIKPIKGVFFAVIFVALTFALLHMDQYRGDWAAIGVVACFGLGLTILRAMTHSSIPGMVAHYVYNTTLIIIPVVMTLSANPIYWEYQIMSPELNVQQKEERLLKSIEVYPAFTEAYNDLAWIYSEQNAKLDKALAYIDQALLLDPNNYAYLDTKAEVLYKLGRKAECLSIAESLVKKYPQNAYLKKQLEKFKTMK